jgi:hypothetical protein
VVHLSSFAILVQKVKARCSFLGRRKSTTADGSQGTCLIFVLFFFIKRFIKHSDNLRTKRAVAQLRQLSNPVIQIFGNTTHMKRRHIFNSFPMILLPLVALCDHPFKQQTAGFDVRNDQRDNHPSFGLIRV